jgi:hypothetical protein
MYTYSRRSSPAFAPMSDIPVTVPTTVVTKNVGLTLAALGAARLKVLSDLLSEIRAVRKVLQEDLRALAEQEEAVADGLTKLRCSPFLTREPLSKT